MFLAWIAIFAISIFVLVKAADYFTDNAALLGKFFKLSNFVIGLVIITIGTTLPEFTTSIFGVASGEVEFLAGNIFGSVIVNLLIGIGLAALFARGALKIHIHIFNHYFLFAAGAVGLFIVCLFDGKVQVYEAGLFIVAYILFIINIFIVQKKKKHLSRHIHSIIPEKVHQGIKSNIHLAQVFAILFISSVLIFISAKLAVDAVIYFASIINIGVPIIAATAVAIGTSLPEIILAAVFARKKHYDLLLGNIIGASIFDILIIFGSIGLFASLTISRNLYFIFSFFALLAIAILFLLSRDKRITKWEGVLLIIAYIVFFGKIINLY